MANTITIVSLGPGDPELITIKGLKTLQKADVIYSPSTLLKSGKTSSRALDILLSLELSRDKIRLYNLPMSKDRSLAISAYDAVAQLAKEDYKKGLNVAITAEGDSGIYSSSHYVIDQLKGEGLPVDKVAGVPAFISAGALAHLHIVKQEEELHIVPGIISQKELQSKLANNAVLVLMKASQCEEDIKEALANSKDIECYYFENIGFENEFYSSDIATIKDRRFPYFSLLILKNRGV